mmetsp:Transcript_37183/g.52534  ORF Transcript_37183/g.52534 Transcript_37183/m.52534 type:complete len:267 (+) Transcript_37183:189-989(+)
MATIGISSDARRKANLKVLQRNDSAVLDIVSSATHVCLYEFKEGQGGWEKLQVEGSLFLVKRVAAADPRFQLIILNRNSTDNFTMPIMGDLQVQNSDPYLITRQKDPELIYGIWFHNGQERDLFSEVFHKVVKSLSMPPPTPTPAPTQPSNGNSIATATGVSNGNVTGTGVVVDQVAAATALMSPLTLGNNTIRVTRGPGPPMATVPQSQPQQTKQQSQSQEPIVLDKKSLQLSLLSLIQDERFLDLIHAQYLKVAHARANRKNDN